MIRYLIVGLLVAGWISETVAIESNGHSGYELAAKKWLKDEFTLSTLTSEQQMKEMRWFTSAAAPFRGMTIRVVSERIDTHTYESNVLTRAFSEITGINVVHELTGEDDVVKKIQTQIQTGVNLYDAYINDSDLIGYHYRSGETVVLSDYMVQEGKDVTLPTLDIDDFIGISFTEGPDGRLYQLPDQQFANLYWYRHDWFSRPDLQAKFKQLYGYELGVPRNWSAYEDIAEFFTVHIKEIDGERVWGHMDYAKTDPSLGWRMSDAWLSMAGAGDKGLPNGYPVDEWGIRVIGCQPVGASVKRGGALDGPAAVYAVTKFTEWLDKYAPPEAKNLNFTEAGTWVAKGNIAQQIFWYTGFTTSLTKPGLSVVNDDGTPKWRMAPSPQGAYWEPGMKLGYQDAGSWTLLKNTPAKRRDAAWLYAQFVVSKTVSLKKTLVGLTPIRASDIESSVMTERAPYLGGLVEFYRSKGRNVWTPTGTNVPDYARLSNYWWQFVSLAVEGKKTVEAAMHEMAEAIDDEMKQIAEDSDLLCKPILNEVEPEDVWLKREGAPKAKRDEQPKGQTSSYEEAIRAWQ
ncbi:ABC transporter substrate-binding protein [Alkalimarinus alittae]|uniref:ABC transporter substrate-binding protein n=1 Tax=Alkalimarinus alittae TaxID=2961619 RepID=A0ABY6N336_9ALTE|nr:ABC transporter substrate-binding protein [Alkalimarinus alittae]UZE96409.1 ABC transporter substrate-binding protein [Alkalimarinus alittae]